MYKRAHILIATILLNFISQEAFAFRTTFDLGSYEALKNAETTEGKKYDSQIGSHLEKKHSKTMKICFDSVKNLNNTGFKIVLLISKNGSVSNFASRPETNISLCLSEALKRDIFPVPPKDNYWIQIDMGIKE